MPTNDTTKFDFLTEPLLSVTGAERASVTGAERASVTLPGLLARLGRGERTEMAALQAHQDHAWHAFVVQLAAIALDRAGDARLDRTEEEWRAALLALTEGAHEPWCLVVADLKRPAIFQPPVPEGSVAKWKTLFAPDELDLLVTAKNHDLKAARIGTARAEHWLFALVSLQTMEGYAGAGNYGIARMNSGFGSRPCVSLARDAAFATRFGRDVKVWRAAREALVEAHGYRAHGGLALLWLPAWDGDDPLSVSRCDPAFIEVCRRARLERREGAVVARATSSKAARLAGKELKGGTGDVWTPVAVDDGAALTVPASGFHYGKLAEVLFGADWKRGPALDVQPEDGPRPVALARALTRGQGKTEGLHDRTVPVPSGAHRFVATSEGRAVAGALAKRRIEAADKLRLKVLKPSVLALLQGGKDELKFDDRRADPFIDAAGTMIDAHFFADLFSDLDERPEEQDARWDRRLLEIGERVLARARDGVPSPTARRYRAIASSESRFWSGARKQLPAAFPPRETNETTTPSEVT